MSTICFSDRAMSSIRISRMPLSIGRMRSVSWNFFCAFLMASSCTFSFEPRRLMSMSTIARGSKSRPPLIPPISSRITPFGPINGVKSTLTICFWSSYSISTAPIIESDLMATMVCLISFGIREGSLRLRSISR